MFIILSLPIPRVLTVKMFVCALEINWQTYVLLFYFYLDTSSDTPINVGSLIRSFSVSKALQQIPEYHIFVQ